jgi:hypothetical protein
MLKKGKKTISQIAYIVRKNKYIMISKLWHIYTEKIRKGNDFGWIVYAKEDACNKVKFICKKNEKIL